MLPTSPGSPESSVCSVPKSKYETYLVSYMKTWTLGLSLATLLHLLNSVPAANCLDCFEIAQGRKVKDVFAELKLNAQAALAGEEGMKPDLFTYGITQKSCTLDGICGT